MIVLWNSAEMTVQLTLIDGDKRTDYEWAAERNLACDMPAYLRDRLAENGASFADISGIGVFRGPGSFTGLRIGLAVLNTIAHEQRIPIVGVTGDAWREECLARLQNGRNDEIVLPEYGAEARITKPRK
jgi:HAD-superfamily hydrolase, subfamily IA, variant 3